MNLLNQEIKIEKLQDYHLNYVAILLTGIFGFGMLFSGGKYYFITPTTIGVIIAIMFFILIFKTIKESKLRKRTTIEGYYVADWEEIDNYANKNNFTIFYNNYCSATLIKTETIKKEVLKERDGGR